MSATSPAAKRARLHAAASARLAAEHAAQGAAGTTHGHGHSHDQNAGPGAAHVAVSQIDAPTTMAALPQQAAVWPPSVRFYASAGAQAQAWRPLAQLVAVANAKRALEDMIEKRRACAREIYAAMRLPRMLALCGHAGSGRRTLVRAYARAAGLNLVELVEHGGTLAAADVEAAYACAAAAPPCLVLVHGCDAALLAGIGLYAVAAPASAGQGAVAVAVAVAAPWVATPLQRALAARLEACEREPGCGVWSVLALERPYTELSPPLAARAYRALWLAPASYAPLAQAMPRDNFAARRALLSLLVRERAHNVDTPETCQFFVSTHDIVVAASVNTTPRQLAAFLDRVFEAPLLRLSVAQINSAPAAALLPTQHDVVAAMRVEGDDLFFITPTTPELAVVQPYEALAHLA